MKIPYEDDLFKLLIAILVTSRISQQVFRRDYDMKMKTGMKTIPAMTYMCIHLPCVQCTDETCYYGGEFAPPVYRKPIQLTLRKLYFHFLSH